ncbi:MAG: Sapep family Mn(2+)-dependent dipeptidase [Mycoplasmataceae bacterium]|nr:Sapep family Mn(2+)-dependent dipeptidase [Mycoplasmataceae bacterium]
MTSREITISNIKDILAKLVSFDTRFIDTDKQNPHGKEVTRAFDYVENYFNERNIEVIRYKNHAVEVVYGQGEKDFVIPVHLDIVPYDKELWNTDPLVLSEKDGYWYGRGTIDDKGAAAILMEIVSELKRQDIKLNRRLKVVFLGDEETTWEGADYYIKNVDKIAEDGFVPDSDFPLVNAEKGVINYYIKGMLPETMDLNYSVRVHSFNLGNVINSVPGKLTVDISFIQNDLTDEIKKIFLDNDRIKVKEKENGIFNIELETVSAHASTPHLGKSAFDKFICMFDSVKFNNSFTRFVNLYKENFYDDIYGKKLSIDSNDDYMGPTTINVGMARYDETNFSFDVDIRQTKTITSDEINKLLDDKFNMYETSFNLRHELLFTPLESNLVKTLLNSYEKVTSDRNAKPFAIGGGTYARLFPNTVAFGPSFSNVRKVNNSNMHGNNENISISSVIDCYAIYLDSIISIK